jgi:hypothetical protein
MKKIDDAKERKKMDGIGEALKDVTEFFERGTVPKDVIDKDFKDIEFTEEDRKAFESGKVQVRSSGDSAFGGSDVRINMGKFYTKDEWEKKHEKMSKASLH